MRTYNGSQDPFLWFIKSLRYSGHIFLPNFFTLGTNVAFNKSFNKLVNKNPIVGLMTPIVGDTPL